MGALITHTQPRGDNQSGREIISFGLGDQGCRGVITLLRIQEYLRNSGIYAAPLAIVEPKQLSRKKTITELLTTVGDKVTLYNLPGDWLRSLPPSGGPEGPLLVYDATPSHLRLRNITLVISAWRSNSTPLTYLAEKPLVVTQQDLQKLTELSLEIPPNITLYCNFVETKAFPLLLARAHILKYWESIHSMKFWRESTIGIQKLLYPDRRSGVTGGALEDKIIHDIALARLLLEAFSRSGEIYPLDPSVTNSCLMPAGLKSALRGVATFRTVTNKISTNPIDAADAVLSFDQAWVYGEKRCPISFYGSWFGVSKQLIDLMGGYGIPPDSWLSASTYEHAVPKEEARICIVQGTLLTGGTQTIIINFLPPNQWVRVFTDQQPGSFITPKDRLDALAFGDNSLARVFIATATHGNCRLHHCFSTEGLTLDFALQVHKAFVLVRDKFERTLSDARTEARLIKTVVSTILREPKHLTHH